MDERHRPTHAHNTHTDTQRTVTEVSAMLVETTHLRTAFSAASKALDCWSEERFEKSGRSSSGGTRSVPRSMMRSAIT